MGSAANGSLTWLADNPVGRNQIMREMQSIRVGRVLHLNVISLLCILRLSIFVPLLIVVITGIWGCSPRELWSHHYQQNAALEALTDVLDCRRHSLCLKNLFIWEPATFGCISETYS